MHASVARGHKGQPDSQDARIVGARSTLLQIAVNHRRACRLRRCDPAYTGTYTGTHLLKATVNALYGRGFRQRTC